MTPWFEKQQSWIAKIGEEFITHHSLVLSEGVLLEGQNYLFCDDKNSGFRNWLIEVCMSVDTGRGSISRFSSETEEHRQVLQGIVVLCVMEIKLLATNDTVLSWSKTTCSISVTSCWELKSKGATLELDKLRFKAHKSLTDQQVWWNSFKQPCWD